MDIKRDMEMEYESSLLLFENFRHEVADVIATQVFVLITVVGLTDRSLPSLGGDDFLYVSVKKSKEL
jgi:hypothetical protein